MNIIYLLFLLLQHSNGLSINKKQQLEHKIPDIYKRDLMNKILLASLGT